MENDLVHSKRKVLAGIVMSNGIEQKVISVATGTKCVLKEHSSVIGDALNDMHAEIISRRCLKSFFFDQLQMLLDSNLSQNSIFESRPAGLGYKLKDNITFHLYINIAPCGDARIFSPHEDGDSCDHNNNKHANGQLRNKIESGEGTIPVNSSTGTLIWDSLIQVKHLKVCCVHCYVLCFYSNRQNDFSPCRVLIKLPAGTCWDYKVRFYRILLSPFI